mgnify:CR=1 FL=1
MATEVLMPKLGLTMTEGTIEEWKFKEGDTVKKGDILFSVATDKLTNNGLFDLTPGACRGSPAAPRSA